MDQKNEARQRARTKLLRMVAILAGVITVFGVTRRLTGSVWLPRLTDAEIAGMLVGLALGTLGVLWWWRRS